MTFNERVRCKGIHTAASLTENKQELWFQEDEMDKIRRSLKKTVKMVERERHEGNDLVRQESDTTTFSLRGLEQHLPAARHETKMRVEDTWDAILGAQDGFLEHAGEYCDNDKIEFLVRSISRQSLEEAQERARQDALEAM